MSLTSTEPALYVSLLLDWYARTSRDLPWRAQGRNHPNPYQVWVSEIMLQQTTVASVTPYFERFLEKFPRVEDLAAAPLESVLTLWQGLGYYSRARNLHGAAKHLMQTHGGIFPKEPEALIKLPGIGPYTAAAVAAMAFDHPCIPVDGNVARVFARLFKLSTPLPSLLKEVQGLVPTFVGHVGHHGDLAQALMDLGATICTPRSPACGVCPWQSQCQAFEAKEVLEYPKRAPQKIKPVKYALAYVMRCPKGALFLRKRPPTGLLASLMEVPSSPWLEAHTFPQETCPPFEASWKRTPHFVRHTFTHFQLRLQVWHAVVTRAQVPLEGQWVAPENLPQVALPTLMKKVIAYANSS